MSKKNNPGTGLAIMDKSSTTAVMAAIQAELDKLKEIAASNFKTGGSGAGKVGGFPRSIQDESDIPTLVRMYSAVHGKANAYDNAGAAITEQFPGFQCPVFKEEGNTADTLKADIILKLKILSVKERREYLEGLLAEAKEFITKEDKFKMFVEKLQGVSPAPPALIEG